MQKKQKETTLKTHSKRRYPIQNCNRGRLIPKLIGEDVVKTIMLNDLGQTFSQNGRKLEESNQTLKIFEAFIGDAATK